MKRLLVLTAILEATTGAALLVVPARLIAILLGNGPRTPFGLVIARVAGAALLSLGVACWSARGDVDSPASRGVVRAMLLYNTTTVALLVYSGVGLGASGIGLWPAAGLHFLLALGCLTCLEGVVIAGPRCREGSRTDSAPGERR